jgi:hypothetical protein
MKQGRDNFIDTEGSMRSVEWVTELRTTRVGGVPFLFALPDAAFHRDQSPMKHIFCSGSFVAHGILQELVFRVTWKWRHDRRGRWPKRLHRIPSMTLRDTVGMARAFASPVRNNG